MDVLIDLTLRDVYKLTEDKSNWDLYKFLQGIGVFQKNRACPENGCGRDMKLRPPVGRRQYGTWCCPRKNCRKTLGALSGTFFEGARLGLVEIFHLSFLWCLGIYTYDAIKSELRRSDGTKISQATVVDYCNFFRDVCCKHYQKNEILIGGPGVVIEIDETVISRRKYNRGRLVGDQWYFGGVERGSGRCFLEAVDRRDAHTLLNILKKHVLPGSIVVSDGWAAYGGIESLPEGYSHYVVNHSQNFVDPESGYHTNTIESTWQKFKARHKRHYGTARSLFPSYISEFLWRRDFPQAQRLKALWEGISSFID